MQAVAELPSGTVTFLFTDLEGSTRRWEEQPEARRAALAAHDSLLREAVEGHRGHVVKSTGDGVFAVFADPHDAVAAAVSGQRVLDSADWTGRRGAACGSEWASTPGRPRRPDRVLPTGA